MISRLFGYRGLFSNNSPRIRYQLVQQDSSPAENIDLETGIENQATPDTNAIMGSPRNELTLINQNLLYMLEISNHRLLRMDLIAIAVLIGIYDLFFTILSTNEDSFIDFFFKLLILMQVALTASNIHHAIRGTFTAHQSEIFSLTTRRSGELVTLIRNGAAELATTIRTQASLANTHTPEEEVMLELETMGMNFMRTSGVVD